MAQEQKWIDPTPASLFLVFCITLVLWAAFTGIISMNAMPVIGFYFLTFGVLWLIAAVINFRNGDLLGGAINGVFGVILGLSSGTSLILGTYFAAKGVELDTRADGFFLFFVGIIFIIFAICAGKRLWLFFSLLLLLGVGFIFLGLTMAGLIAPTPGFMIGGWLMFAGGIFSLYTGSSMVINFSFGRPVLPLGGPLY